MDLANIFGGDLGGLLAPEEQQKLQNQALLSAGLGILAGSAGGQRRGIGMAERPTLAQALLQGFQAGGTAYQSGAQNIIGAREYQARLEEVKRKRAMEAEIQNADGLQAKIETALKYGRPDIAEQYQSLMPKPKERKTATVGNVVVDVETGQPIYTGEKDLKAPPTRERQVGRMRVQEELQRDGTWREIGRGAMDAPQQPQRPSYSTFTGGDGQVYRINSLTGVAEPVAIAGSGKPLTGQGATPKITADQQQNAGFAKRMAEAEKDLSTLPTNVQKSGFIESGIGMISETGANLTRDPSRQKALQAQREWVRAKLRKESGAAIGKDEMENEIRTYFPQIGDTQDVIDQKAKARQVATQTIIEGSGGAYVPFSPALGTPILAPKDAVMGGWSIKKKGGK